MRTPSRFPQLQHRLSLRSSGLAVSPVCLGVVAEPDTVLAAFDAGINFFFVTADLHWPLYDPLRRGLAALLTRSPSLRDQIVVAVVSYTEKPDFLEASFDEVLAAVPGLGHIDAHILGGTYVPDFFPRLHYSRRLRADGVVGLRALGASFHDRQAAIHACNDELIDIAYVRYNALHAGARADLFPHLRAGSSTLLYNFKNVPYAFGDAAWRTLALDGYWRPQPTDFYRFIFTATPLDGMLCSLAAPEHVRALADALGAGPVDDEEQQYLLDLCELVAGRAALVAS